MTVKKRPQLWTRVVPGGWKVISLRQGATINPFYLSPDGKRFASLEAVKVHVASARADLSDAEMDGEGREVKKKKRRKRKRQAGEEAPSEPVAKKLKFDDLEDDKTKAPLSLPIEIQKRRKLLAARSPFRNLLKKTLVRNHVRMRGKLPFMMTGPDSNSLKRPAAVMDDKSEPHSSPSKRHKTIHDSPSKRGRTSDDSPSNERKISEEFSEAQVTPPRPLFPPPNLTPPVRRPVSRLNFESPNMRSVSSRVRITKPLNQANSPLKRELF